MFQGEIKDGCAINRIFGPGGIYLQPGSVLEITERTTVDSVEHETTIRIEVGPNGAKAGDLLLEES